MITIKAGTVHITEQTVHELLRAIEEAKKITIFTESPMPDGDMEIDYYIRCKRERGSILVKTPFSDIEFEVSLETKPHTQESLGYELDPGRVPIEIGKDGRCMCRQGEVCPLGRVGMQERCTKADLIAGGIEVVEKIKK